MRELEFRVTIDEANLILEGLGNLPFAKVYALVTKIQEQASRQVRNNGASVPDADVAAAPARTGSGHD
jgi:hypothetical protein